MTQRTTHTEPPPSSQAAAYGYKHAGSMASHGVAWSHTVTKLKHSSLWITDASGNVNQYLAYTSTRLSTGLHFGELSRHPERSRRIDQRAKKHDIRFKFTGKERDAETGYDYFGARYYDSDISVWLSVDPLSDMYPSTSPFMYVRGNPVMMVDPNGMNDGWVENDGKVFWDDNVNSQKEANAKYGNDAVHHEEYIANEGNNTYYLGKDGSVDASNGETPTERTFSSENGIAMQSDISGVSITGNNTNTKKNSDYSEILEMAIPVAISVEGSFSGECGYGASGTPYGGIFIFRGQDAWTYTGFTAANIGIGWFGASMTASQTTYYYFGDLDNFRASSFSGWSTQFQISSGEILIGGGHFNVVKDVNGGILFGVGPDIGFGVGSPISGQLTRQKTKLHK